MKLLGISMLDHKFIYRTMLVCLSLALYEHSIAQDVPGIDVNSPTVSSSSSNKPTDANSYCQKVMSSTDAQRYTSKYVEILTKLNELINITGGSSPDSEMKKTINEVRRAFYLGMDDDSRSKTRGLVKKLNEVIPKKDSYNQDTVLLNYLPWFSGCASKLKDSPLKFIFFDPTLAGRQLSSFYETDVVGRNQKLQEIWGFPSLGGIYDRSIQEKTNLPIQGINPFWVTPLLFVSDDPNLKPEASQSIGRLDLIISQLNSKIQSIKEDIQLVETSRKSQTSGASSIASEVPIDSSKDQPITAIPRKLDQRAEGSNLPLISATEFCKRLTGSKELKEFAAIAKKAINYNIRYQFDTSDNLLAQWLLANSPTNPKIANKFKMDLNQVNEYLMNIEYAASQCALTLTGNDLLYIFAENLSGYDALVKQINEQLNNSKQEPGRVIDANGNIVQTVDSKKSVNQRLRIIGSFSGSYLNKWLTHGPGPGSGDRDRNKFWIPIATIVIDDSGKVIKNLYPEIEKNLLSQISDLENERAIAKAKMEKETKERTDREAAEKAIREAESSKWTKFRNSADGKLTLAYQYFQVVDVCFKMRKGYAVIFINELEYVDVSKKYKMIESILKPSLINKNTDKLWADAIERNQKYDNLEGTGLGSNPIKIDLIGLIKSNNKDNLMAAKNDCVAIYGRFNDMSIEVLGKEAPKKPN